MAYKILRLPEVIDRVGLARSSIYAFVSEGRFPAPIKIGTRAVGWLDTDIDQWIGFQCDRAKLNPATCYAERTLGRIDGGMK